MIKNIKADKTLWLVAIALALFSLLPVYSASSNIAFLHKDGNTINMLLKHFSLVLFGILCMYLVQLVSYRKFGALSKVLMPVALIMLLYTLINGHRVADAARWIKVPVVNLTFQTSSFAALVLTVYIARMLVILPREKLDSFQASFWTLLAPIVGVCLLILPANFSTALMVFITSVILLAVGGYTIKNLLKFFGLGIAGLGLFILVVMAFPSLDNRLGTWQSRIESFYNGDTEENYQVHQAKIAIAEGNVFGKGPGKSVQKNFLPQSNSDFIYAIIVEEFGMVGGILVLFFYVIFLMRILIISSKAPTRFGSLVAYGVGIGILMQAFINLGVAVNLFPVTGQTLPLISSGGTSIAMNGVAVGIILSVSKAEKEKDKPEEPQDSDLTETFETEVHEEA